MEERVKLKTQELNSLEVKEKIMQQTIDADSSRLIHLQVHKEKEK